MKEFFGRSEKDAVARAAAMLGKEPEEIKYVVMTNLVPNPKRESNTVITVDVDEQAAKAVPGLLSKEEETARQQGGDAWVNAWCTGVLRRMGFEPRTVLERDAEKTVLRVNFTGNPPALNRGAMRGMRGAMQHLVGRLAAQSEAKTNQYVVDLCGTLDERKFRMSYLASQLKNHLEEKSKWIGIHMMESQDRGLLHLALKEVGLESESRGEGQFRVLGVRRPG